MDLSAFRRGKRMPCTKDHFLSFSYIGAFWRWALGMMGRVKADAGRKYRAYPTEVQDQVLTRWGHTARALWNVALEQRVYLWEQRR
ncbi:helix-turn-helix domain-containing protein [Streptomyces sp. NPDC059656]|uniref:helix-turn-helix domain-containing protein n=2 Tax=unclassified Streptomyces TaxID=2593676 RepID=UPI0036C7EB3B